MTIYELYAYAFALFTARYMLPALLQLAVCPGEGDRLIAEVRNNAIRLYETDQPKKLLVHTLLHELGHVKSFEWEYRKKRLWAKTTNIPRNVCAL